MILRSQEHPKNSAHIHSVSNEHSNMEWLTVCETILSMPYWWGTVASLCPTRRLNYLARDCDAFCRSKVCPRNTCACCTWPHCRGQFQLLSFNKRIRVECSRSDNDFHAVERLSGKNLLSFWASYKLGFMFRQVLAIKISHLAVGVISRSSTTISGDPLLLIAIRVCFLSNNCLASGDLSGDHTQKRLFVGFWDNACWSGAQAPFTTWQSSSIASAKLCV